MPELVLVRSVFRSIEAVVSGRTILVRFSSYLVVGSSVQTVSLLWCIQSLRFEPLYYCTLFVKFMTHLLFLPCDRRPSCCVWPQNSRVRTTENDDLSNRRTDITDEGVTMSSLLSYSSTARMVPLGVSSRVTHKPNSNVL